MSRLKRLKILKEIFQKINNNDFLDSSFLKDKFLPPFERDSLNYGYMNSSEINIYDNVE